MKDQLYDNFGIKLILPILGFCGGVLSLAFIRNLTVGWAFIAVFAGTVCAAVFTPMVNQLWQLPPSFEAGVAFIIGIGGLSLIGKIHQTISNIQLEDLLRKSK